MHAHPDGTDRRYSRATIDRWLRQWRTLGLDGLRPQQRGDTGIVRSHPELADVATALRIEVPARSAAQIADIIWHRHGVRMAERTVRAQLRRRGLHRAALAAEPKVFGRYEAERSNERWITDVLVGPFVPFPKTVTSPEFQRDAVAMVLDEGRTIADVARSIGVVEGTLGNWVAKARRERAAGSGVTADERGDNAVLRGRLPPSPAPPGSGCPRASPPCYDNNSGEGLPPPLDQSAPHGARVR